MVAVGLIKGKTPQEGLPIPLIPGVEILTPPEGNPQIEEMQREGVAFMRAQTRDHWLGYVERVRDATRMELVWREMRIG